MQHVAHRASDPKMDGSYYAEGRTVHRRPLRTEKPDGTASVTFGTPVCTVSDWLAPDAAQTIADALNGADEMLAALRDCVRAYEEHRDQRPTGNLWPDPNHIHAARRVIAKIEGRY